MRCAKCDAEIETKTLGGLCPVCLLDSALPDETTDEAGEFHYDLIEEIARGGMGVVYRAIQHGSHRQVAVKMLVPEQAATPGMMERFRSEAEAVASLDHPHILPIYEIGESDGRPFYSMKFASGGTLRDLAADLTQQPRDAARLIATTARAVHHAHERGILHRDLKPGNILLDGADHTPYVSDFGIAKWLGRESRLTLASTALGTPHYIAPEQAAGSSIKLTPAGDVYSLGAILYELLTGRPPFAGDTPLETLRLSRETEPPSPRSLKPTVPRDLEVICLKCLAKEPSARYSSAAALAEDLERWLEGHTILARPTTSIERAWRWTNRNRVVAALSGALFIALLTMAVAWLLFQRTPRSLTNVSSAPAKSIAVLPFENLSDEQNAFFVAGVQDEILTDLAKIADLKVISRASVMSYTSGARRNLREIGQQLGVAYLLEGSVQRSGNQVRVTTQLIDARTDSHVWAQTYDRDLADVFAIQTEIARAIADTLKAKLTRTEEKAIALRPTKNAEAYDEYLRGIAIDYSVFDLNKLSYAEKYFQRAVELDPAFALAWAQLAKVHSYFYYADFDTTPARREATRVAAETAMKLAPDAGEAYLALGYYQFHCERNLAAAAQAFENAHQRLPNNSDALQGLGTIFSHQGRDNEALSKITEALQLDPRDASLIRRLMVFQSFFRRFTEAHATADRAFEIAPDDSAVLANQADIYQAEGDLEKASQVLARLRKEQVFEKVNETCSQIRQLIYQRQYDAAINALGPILAKPQPSIGIRISEYYALLATAQKLNGDNEGAKNTCAKGRDFLLTAIQKTGGTQGYVHAMLALMYAGLGEKESALKEGNAALALEGDDTILTPAAQEILAQIEVELGEKDSALGRLPQLLTARYHSWLYFVPLTPAHLRLDPMWDPLRGDPRFDEIAAKIESFSSSQATTAPEKSIAVLPFLDLSPAKDQEYFCDGISEEILDSLSKIEGLHVVSRTSSFSLRGSNLGVKEIAQKLGVQNILEGSLRREGNRIRVTAQLINARDGFHLWSETYERELQGVFAVQDEITRAITDALKIKLVGARPAQKQNAEAYDLYLQGLFFSNKSTEEGLRKSLEFFQRSLEKDPNSAKTWAGIAGTWNWLADAYVKPLEAFPQMKAAAEKAVALDPNNVEAHIWIGNAKRTLDWDLEGFKIELNRALQLDPNSAPAHNFMGLYEATQGRKEAALAHVRASLRLDPLSPIISDSTAFAYLWLGRVDDAITEAKRTLELDPNYIYMSPALANGYLEKGMFAEAIALFQKAQQMTAAPQPGLAVTYARMERQSKARQILEELKKVSTTKYIAVEEIASVYVALGEKDEALKWLERGCADHGGMFHNVAFRPEFRTLHSDPRFADLLKRIGLDPAKVLLLDKQRP